MYNLGYNSFERSVPMRRKPLALVLALLIVVVSLLAGCRRSAVPPIDALVLEEDEALSAIQEAEQNTEGLQNRPQATDIPPADLPTTDEPATEEPAQPSEVVEEPGVATEAPPEPAATTAPAAVPPTAVVQQPGTHVVQPGENLFRIALRYDTTVAAIARANNITNPSLLSVGQTLTIPSGNGGSDTPTAPTTPGRACSITYTVRPGDNLFRIALRHNQSQAYLAQVNGITNPAMIRVGQVICIP
jgi:LysM repeat protein